MLAQERRTWECSKLKSTTPLENPYRTKTSIWLTWKNLFAGNIASSPSESMRTKDLSQRQRRCSAKYHQPDAAWQPELLKSESHSFVPSQTAKFFVLCNILYTVMLLIHDLYSMRAREFQRVSCRRRNLAPPTSLRCLLEPLPRSARRAIRVRCDFVLFFRMLSHPWCNFVWPYLHDTLKRLVTKQRRCASVDTHAARCEYDSKQHSANTARSGT